MSDQSIHDLSPELRLRDTERRKKFRELLTATARLPRDRQDAILFGEDGRGGVVARALGCISAFVVHRECHNERARDTWWHRAYDETINDWSKRIA